MSGIIKIREGTAADLSSSNPGISANEWAIENDTGKIKKGPGAFNDLDYMTLTLSGISSDDMVKFREVTAASDGQSTFSFPAANGQQINLLFAGAIRITPDRFDHSGDDIILTNDDDISSIEAGMKISILFQNIPI